MKLSTRSLSLLLVLALLCSLFVLPAAAEETAGITITDAAGTEFSISAEAIQAAEAVTVTDENPCGYNDNSFTGTFYSVKSILETAGIDVSEAHGLKSVASDGFTNGFSTEDLEYLYIYDMGTVLKNGEAAGEAGTYGTAIIGVESAGNKWAKGIVSISVAADHVWFFKKGECKHYCSICGDAEPSVTVTAADGTETTVYACMIQSAEAVEVTADNPWGYGSNTFTGTFYSVKSIFEAAGIDVSEAHGLKSVASDGFTNGFTIDDVANLYIYDMGAVLKNGEAAGEAGTYGTAIMGTEAAGNKWAKDVVTLAVAADHVMFVKGGNCKHYCSICGADEEVVASEAVPATDHHSGLTEGSHYAFCGEYVTAPEKTPALSNPFADVSDPDAYYYDPVLWAADADITYGTSDTAFSPEQSCTRAEIVTFLWRMAGEPAPSITSCDFTDVPESAYYYEAVLWAVEKEITAGTSDTTFSPDKTCDRSEIVTFLYRAAGEPESTAEACSFTDVAEDSWYYNAVLWAVEQKITYGTTETTFGPTEDCVRGQAVSFLYRAADLLFAEAES